MWRFTTGGSTAPPTSPPPPPAADRTPPEEFFVDSPHNNQTFTGEIEVAGWAKDQGSGVDRIEIWLDGNGVGNAQFPISRPDVGNTGYRWTADAKIHWAQSYQLVVRACDKAGNCRDINRTFNVQDITAPHEAFIDGPAANATLKGTVTVEGWATDKQSDIGRVEIWFDGKNQGNAQYGHWRDDLAGNLGYRFNLDTTRFANGNRTLEVRFFDGAGNRTVRTRSVKVDNTPGMDAAFVSQEVPASMIAGQKYQVKVTFRNTGTQTWTRDTNFRLGSQNPPDNSRWGLGRVALATNDRIATGQSKTFTFEVTAPTGTGNQAFQWKMLRENVAWFGANSPTVTVRVVSPPTAPTFKSAGCTATTNVWQRTCAKPSFSWNAASGGVGGIAKYLIYWGETSNANPATNKTAETTGLTFNPAAIGSGRTFYLRVRAQDHAGNLGPIAQLFVLRYDATVPQNPTNVNPGCTATDDVWQNTCANANFTWSGASDAHSGLDGYFYYWGTSNSADPSTWTTSAGHNPSAVSSSGVYRLRVKTRDKAGNVSNATTLFTLRYDATPPSNPTSVNPGCQAVNNEWQESCAAPSFTWSGASDAHSGVKDYLVYWGPLANGNPTQTVATAAYSAAAAPSGTPYYLRIRTRDQVGNLSNPATLFTLKYLAPPTLNALVVHPPVSTVGVGEAFSVFVNVETPATVDGASAYLDFDPTMLQLESVTAGTTLSSVIQNEHDNVLGQVDYAAGLLDGNLPGGRFAGVTLTFRALASTGETSLTIVNSGSRRSDLTREGVSVLDEVRNGVVLVQAAAASAAAEEGEGEAPVNWELTDVDTDIDTNVDIDVNTDVDDELPWLEGLPSLHIPLLLGGD